MASMNVLLGRNSLNDSSYSLMNQKPSSVIYPSVLRSHWSPTKCLSELLLDSADIDCIGGLLLFNGDLKGVEAYVTLASLSVLIAITTFLLSHCRTNEAFNMSHAFTVMYLFCGNVFKIWFMICNVHYLYLTCAHDISTLHHCHLVIWIRYLKPFGL